MLGWRKIPQKGYGQVYGGWDVPCRITKHPLYGEVIQVDPAETHLLWWVNNGNPLRMQGEKDSPEFGVDHDSLIERELELAKAIRSTLWVEGAKGWTVVPPNLEKLANWAKAQNCLAAQFNGDWDKIPITHQVGADETEGIVENPTEVGELRFLREFELAILNIG